MITPAPTRHVAAMATIEKVRRTRKYQQAQVACIVTAGLSGYCAAAPGGPCQLDLGVSLRHMISMACAVLLVCACMATLKASTFKLLLTQCGPPCIGPQVQPQAAAEMVEAGWTYLDVR